MSRAEFHERILMLLRGEPFEPFEIEKIDGSRLMVAHPRMVATNGGAGAYGAADGEIIFFDWTDTRRLGRDAAAASA